VTSSDKKSNSSSNSSSSNIIENEFDYDQYVYYKNLIENSILVLELLSKGDLNKKAFVMNDVNKLIERLLDAVDIVINISHLGCLLRLIKFFILTNDNIKTLIDYNGIQKLTISFHKINKNISNRNLQYLFTNISLDFMHFLRDFCERIPITRKHNVIDIAKNQLNNQINNTLSSNSSGELSEVVNLISNNIDRNNSNCYQYVGHGGVNNRDLSQLSPYNQQHVDSNLDKNRHNISNNNGSLSLAAKGINIAVKVVGDILRLSPLTSSLFGEHEMYHNDLNVSEFK
jgi:hypothetical protein